MGGKVSSVQVAFWVSSFQVDGKLSSIKVDGKVSSLQVDGKVYSVQVDGKASSFLMDGSKASSSQECHFHLVPRKLNARGEDDVLEHLRARGTKENAEIKMSLCTPFAVSDLQKLI